MFDNSEAPYPEGALTAKNEGNLMDMTPTMTERLQRERQTLKTRLAQVEEALAAIESNPQVQQVVDALTKLHWLR